MAIQQFTGTENGTQFINKLNHNFGEGQNGGALRIKMERGGLKNTGAMDYTIASYNGYVRSQMLIKVNDATSVVGKTLTGFTIYEFGQNFSFIKTSSEGDTFDSNTKYIKIVKQTNDIMESALFVFDGDVEEVYNVQIEKGTYSDGGVTRLKSEMLVFGVSEGICTTARLILPPNYSISGQKVPLIIWDACDGSYSWGRSIDYVGSTPSSITTQLQYLNDEGFAVLEIYPWGSRIAGLYNPSGGAVPIPTSLMAHEKAVEYITSRFNISDTNIFLSSWSGSGKLSSFYAIHRPSFNLRSIYAFSPVVDGLSFVQWSAPAFRKALNEDMKFGGDTSVFLGNGAWPIADGSQVDFITANAGKFAKCAAINWQNMVGKTITQKIADSISFSKGFWVDHSSNIYNRHDLSITSGGVPITIIASADDEQCPYLVMEEFIIQLKNGGAEAKIITLPNNTGKHRAATFGNEVDNDGDGITTRYGNNGSGVFYASIPFGWHYMVEDIYARFLKD